MSGLAAAHILRTHCDVTLFDKSRGAGGRLSTRYAGDYEFDHGAQYFTVQDAEFKAHIDAASLAGACAPWTGRALYLKSGEMVKDTGKDRYVGTPCMNSLPKFMAQNLDLKLGRRVSKMTRNAGKWRLEFEGAEHADQGQSVPDYDAVICTAPPAQAAILLPHNFAQMGAVQSAKMQACFALMIGLPSAVDFGWDSLRLNDLPVAWMAANHRKPQRNSDVTSLVIHADAAWSQAHQDADRDWVQAQLLGVAAQICGADMAAQILDAPHKALHRWLYASVETSPQTPCLYDTDLRLAACGDWCSGGRVEGAYHSGVAAGRSILAALM